MCLIFVYKSNSSKVIESFVEDKNKYYSIYSIDMNESSLNTYKSIFEKIDSNNYIIKDIKIVNNYNNYILEEINKIKIKNKNYIDSINEYIERSIIILNKYNLENEISKLKSGNFKIDKIVIYTTKDIYNQIMSHITFSIKA